MECSLCEEPKPVHRKLTLTKDYGELLDSANYCEDCWNDIRASVEDASGLRDGRQEN